MSKKLIAGWGRNIYEYCSSEGFLLVSGVVGGRVEWEWVGKEEK